MEGWNSWEIWSLLIAAYVAVVSLVRLMLAHRDRLARELDEQIVAERQRLALEELQSQRDSRRREQAETRRAA